MAGSDLARSLAAHYSIERELGGGGMARVFVARDESLGRRIVVKVLPPELAAHVSRERFSREIRLAAQLAHPHIVPLLSAGETDGLPYYTMPFVEGESLRIRLQRESRLPSIEAARIVTDIAAALDYAHRRGIVHRDIKPDNVLLQDGQALITDFGIARALTQSTGDAGLTESGIMVGTPAYMSPEQVAGDADVDARSDVYALGCLFFELLAGAPPYRGDSVRAMIAQHFSAPVPSLRASVADVPESYDAAIAKALAKDPAQRFESAGAFASAISTATLAPAREPRVSREQNARPSIAVLPFANLSPDPADAYFADGLADEIITDLSPLRGIRVIARASAQQFRESSKDATVIARELGVRYVLEGSVRRSGGSVRLTTRLVDADDGATIWTDKMGGAVDDVFALQERVSRTIVDALKVRLTHDEDRGLTRAQINPAVYDCVLRARSCVQRFTEEGIREGIGIAHRGLRTYGEHPLILAVLGEANVRLANVVTSGRGEHLAKALAFATRMLELDPESPDADFIQGFVYLIEGDLQKSVIHLKRTLQRRPQHADALFWILEAYGMTGHAEVARPLARRLAEVDPLNTGYRAMEGWVELIDGNAAAALGPYREMYAQAPDSPFVRWCYALVVAFAGSIPEAVTVLDRLIADAPTNFWASFGRLQRAALTGDRGAARQAESPELLDALRGVGFYAWVVAGCYARLEEPDHSLQWLERAVALGFINYPLLNDHDPAFGALRHDTRFAHLMTLVRERWMAFAP